MTLYKIWAICSVHLQLEAQRKLHAWYHCWMTSSNANDQCSQGQGQSQGQGRGQSMSTAGGVIQETCSRSGSCSCCGCKTLVYRIHIHVAVVFRAVARLRVGANTHHTHTDSCARYTAGCMFTWQASPVIHGCLNTPYTCIPHTTHIPLGFNFLQSLDEKLIVVPLYI